MSAINPIIPIPVPNIAAEDAARPHDPDAPVNAVSATGPARAVESEENRPPSEYQNAPDAYDLSRAARAMAETSRPQEDAEREADPLDAVRIRDNRSIRELMQTFQNYNNSAAVSRFVSHLDGFIRYGAPYTDSGEPSVIANLRAQENAVYTSLGLSRNASRNLEVRESVAQAIDRWFAGSGVFSPEMLRYSSVDGFRFVPLSTPARATTRAAEVLSTYDRNRIAAYLREMALLTPQDFMFYDPTGLGALGLDDRRTFLAQVDELLRQQRIDARAAELRYIADEEERIRVETLEDDDRIQTRLDELRDEINTYYGQLRYMVHQYKAGIISEALA
ncbi:MAG: hypothetical protein LUC93_01190 [Planctomycetaceae bacterium]|nr:hypothetical protein [Planctomycetaceae bacterium]